MKYIALCLALIAAPLAADPSWSQYFEAPGAQVQRGLDGQGRVREILRLDGDVQIQRLQTAAGWEYAGVDFSDHGSVGCMARVLIEFQRMAQHCPDLTSPDQVGALDAKLARLAAFYSENAVPRTTAAGFLQDVQTSISARPAMDCAAITEDFIAFRDQIVSPDYEPEFSALLSVPRLPVTNPCF